MHASLSLAHFIKQCLGTDTLYMMSSLLFVNSAGYGCLVGVLSVSGRAVVGSRLVGVVGSRPDRAVEQGAGRSGQAVGLRGFASPDVLKYRLTVFGVSVSNYSDSSPQASGQLGKVGRRFFGECSWK